MVGTDAFDLAGKRAFRGGACNTPVQAGSVIATSRFQRLPRRVRGTRTFAIARRSHPWVSGFLRLALARSLPQMLRHYDGTPRPAAEPSIRPRP